MGNNQNLTGTKNRILEILLPFFSKKHQQCLVVQAPCNSIAAHGAAATVGLCSPPPINCLFLMFNFAYAVSLGSVSAPFLLWTPANVSCSRGVARDASVLSSGWSSLLSRPHTPSSNSMPRRCIARSSTTARREDLQRRQNLTRGGATRCL